MTKLKKIIDAFSEKYPNWDTIVADYLRSDDDETTPQHKEVLDAFSEILTNIERISKENNLSIKEVEEVFKSFDCWDFIRKYLSLKLETLGRYAALRRIAEEDIYKAIYCVDLIWSSYILRFDPYIVFDEKIPLAENAFKDVSSQLDQFIDQCIERQLTKSAAALELEKESYLPKKLCEYIAEKYETDYNQIRMNHLIYRLSSCEKILRYISDRV